MTRNYRTVSLSSFLTQEEIEKAVRLQDAASIKRYIIEPNIKRINEALGQENDATYLSYAVEYALRLIANKRA